MDVPSCFASAHPNRRMTRAFALLAGIFALVCSLVCATPAFAGPSYEEVGTVNAGSYLPNVADRSDESGANLFGFDTSKSNTEDYGTMDPSTGWMGVVPKELLSITNPASNWSEYVDVTLDDIVSSTGASNGYHHYNNNVYTGASDTGAIAPIDLTHSGRDDAIMLCNNEDFYDEWSLRLASVRANYSSDDPGDTLHDNSGAIFGIPVGNGYLAGSSPHNTQDDAPTMQDPNRYHLATGDIDGNGSDDAAVFIYGENNPELHLFFMFRSESSLVFSGKDWHRYELESSGYLDGCRYLFVYHKKIDLPRYQDTKYYGLLPASLAVDDLSGDGNDDVIVAYQEGSPNGGAYVTNIGVYQANGGTLTNGFVEPAVIGDSKPWLVPDRATTQMTSAAVGDPDNDGHNELVIGGYGGYSATDGELYLSYLEWVYDGEADATGHLDRGNIHGFTWMTDDNGLHRTTGSELPGHRANVDTSLYHEDPDSRYCKADGAYYTLSRYTNSSNWTVPLACASLTGHQNNATCDQVFFGMFWYDYNKDTNSFTPHRNTFNNHFNGHDGNNVLLLMTEATTTEDMLPVGDGQATVETMTNYAGTEVLYCTSMFDEDEGHGDDIRYDHYIFRDSGSSTGWTYWSDRDDIEWGDKSARWATCLGNFDFSGTEDQDALFMKLVGHEFIYTEPAVESVLFAPPAFKDIQVAEGSAYDSGSTALTDIDGDTVDGSASVSIGFDFQILAGFKVGKTETSLGVTPGFSVAPSYKGSVTHEVWKTVSTSKGQDSAVVTCTPLDLYYYEIWRPGASEENEYAVMKAPGTPQVEVLSLEEYDKCAAQYNEMAEAYNKAFEAKMIEVRNEYGLSEVDFSSEALAYMPRAETFALHTKGRPDTYKQPDRLDTSQFDIREDETLGLDHGQAFGATARSLTCTWKHSDGGGVSWNVKQGLKFHSGTRFSDFDLMMTLNESGSVGKTFYYGNQYKGEFKSVTTDWNDYDFEMGMYAGRYEDSNNPDRLASECSFAGGTDPATFNLVGYSAKRVQYGPAVAHGLAATSVTSHEATFEAQLPWGAHNAPGAYLLQRKNANTGAWDTVHTFEKRNVTDENAEDELWTETYTDTGLAPSTAYAYRIVDDEQLHAASASITTKATQLFRVDYPANGDWGHMTARAVAPVTGSISYFVSGGNVPENSDLTFKLHLADGYAVTGWNVTETAGGTTKSLLSDPRVTVSGDMLTLQINDIAGAIDVSPIILSPENEPVVLGSWQKSNNRWWFKHYNGSYPKATWLRVPSAWYHFDADGWMQTGWLRDGKTWYYLDKSGAMTTDWKKVDGAWYHFDDNGAMTTGWLRDNGRWYYLNRAGEGTEGAAAIGWKKVGGKWYYFQNAREGVEGSMLPGGWHKIDGTWYLMNGRHDGTYGAMMTGWKKLGETWYYLDESGAMQTGWQKIGSTWYYLNDNGAMQTGPKMIDGKVHWFAKSGAWLK